jgi:hypothetical protein
LRGPGGDARPTSRRRSGRRSPHPGEATMPESPYGRSHDTAMLRPGRSPSRSRPSAYVWWCTCC